MSLTHHTLKCMSSLDTFLSQFPVNAADNQ